MYFKNLAVALACLIVASCASNPVTGKKELNLVSESQEIDIGTKNYFATQQSQGGVFITDPILNKYVQTLGKKLVAVSDRTQLPYEFVVLNNPIPNAWALPGGKIAINRGLLLELDNEAELAAVVAHEIVHAAARHGAQSMERGLLLGLGIAAVGIATGDKNNSTLIVGAAGLGSALINNKYGRDAELESDLYGMKYMAKAGYNPIAAVTLQEKFMALSKNKKTNWVDGLFASHPPSQERVQANKQTALTLGNKGVLNTALYRNAIAKLINTKAAYDAYDQGMKALSQNNPKAALDFAEKALTIEPQESTFHALKGNAWSQLNNLVAAESSFTSAINFNSRYFLHYLQRGLLREKLNNDRGAIADLNQSIKLLPTEKAHYTLGNIALRLDNSALAKQHFAKAGNNASELGIKAAIEYAKLDLPENPNKYLNMHIKLDNYNKLLINIENSAPVAIKDISFMVSVKLNGNQANKEKLTLKQTINPGDKQIFSTQITTIPGQTTLKDVTVSILKFQIVE